jgi:hypothetical protein
VEQPPGIGTVGKQLLEKRELSEQGGQQHDAAVAILNIGGRDQCVQQQTQRIDENGIRPVSTALPTRAGL